jgi:hypothetical protein
LNTHEFKAATGEYEFVLDGAAAESPDISDRNAILNGFTLERLSATNDSDGDGLPDDWEAKYFSGLGEGGTDDSDGDGLGNAQELTQGTVPSDADTDDDGLMDGQEVTGTRTDPNKRDTDGDGLDDGAEVNVHRTDPTKTDTDGDGFGDARELEAGPIRPTARSSRC